MQFVPIQRKSFKAKLTPFTRDVKELDAHAFMALSDTLSANGYQLGISEDGFRLALLSKANGSQCELDFAAIVDRCIEWNLESQKATAKGQKAMVLEEEAEELQLIREHIPKKRHDKKFEDEFWDEAFPEEPFADDLLESVQPINGHRSDGGLVPFRPRTDAELIDELDAQF